MIKIALITPINKFDYLTDTIIDGLLSFDNIQFVSYSENYPSKNWNFINSVRTEAEFCDFAKKADLIFLMYGKESTNFSLAEKINTWNKTIFIDGSELGKNRRYDKEILNSVSAGIWMDNGKINQEMLKKCALYFRREKPYLQGITPLPFGIESRYRKFYSPGGKKDIDYVCIFGQEDYPPMRTSVREYLEKYCQKHGFNCVTKKTES